MTPNTTDLRAREAYSRYGAVTDYKNFQGNPMPEFQELPEKIQQAWVAAATLPEAAEQHQLVANIHIGVCRAQGVLNEVTALVERLKGLIITLQVPAYDIGAPVPEGMVEAVCWEFAEVMTLAETTPTPLPDALQARVEKVKQNIEHMPYGRNHPKVRAAFGRYCDSKRSK